MFRKIFPKIILLLVFVAAVYFSVTTDLFKTNQSAGIRVENTQGEAAVFIDDQYLGQTPLLDENLQSGDVIVKIVPEDENLAIFSLPLTLEKKTLSLIIYSPGENPQTSSSLIFELKKLGAEKTALSIESYPEEAIVSIDGGEGQKSPLKINNIGPGEHHFATSLAAYYKSEHGFQILEGYESRITINLAKNLDAEKEIEEDGMAFVFEASNSAEISGAKVKIKATNYFVDQQEGLKVREASNSSSSELGLVKTGFFYPYLEQKSEDQDWLMINFFGTTAWIASQFAEIIE